MNTLRNYFNWFRASVRGFDSPHQLALGFSLGMLLGLLPKDSLLFYGLGILAILTSGNLVCLACGGLIFHFISPMLDPQMHQIGLAVLMLPALETTWNYFSELPLAGWTRFNNTIVMGALVTGLTSFLPVYLVSRTFFKRFGTRLRAWFDSSNFARWLIGPNTTLTEN